MAKRFYCTLFDSFYLPRGLAMAESLWKNDPESHLTVFAFDDNSEKILREQKTDRLTVISLSQLETPELLAVKPSRSKAEYCWTCTPAVLLHCLEKLGQPSCTYIDADLIFYSSPEILFQEQPAADVLITEHRYSLQNQFLEERSGKYCVQFMHFKNNPNGLGVLRWWRDRCLEWCYARHEDGKFGDQKYLDDWLTRFQGIACLQNLGAGVAPWNVDQYEFMSSGSSVQCWHLPSHRILPLIFYHFHGLQMFDNSTVALGPYKFNENVLECLYRPYLSQLTAIERGLEHRPGYRPPRAKNPNGALQPLRELKRWILNRNRRYPLTRFVGT